MSTGEVLAERLEDVMRSDEFGLQPEMIDGIIMDNARVCEKANRLLISKFAHITAYGCSAHAANLLAGDVCSVPCVDGSLKLAQKIAKLRSLVYFTCFVAQATCRDVCSCISTCSALYWVFDIAYPKCFNGMLQADVDKVCARA